jgi:aryl-alcohol dehydrogenase-like predicted oxidoreductase
MQKRKIAGTTLEVSALCLGGNVFGWTADEAQSFAVLDRFVEAGGNFIDTADVYSMWVPGNKGGESESILGRWMASRNLRGKVIIATKVGWKDGLAAQTIEVGVEASLRRLGLEQIDLYYSHKDDLNTPVEETVRALDRLVRAGKVRYLGASNFTAERLSASLAVSAREGLARYVVLQPHYNLLHREEYEGALQTLCQKESIACAPYFGLARGFLTGKYRPGLTVESARAQGASVFMNDRGWRTLSAVEEIAQARGVTMSAVALAWLAAQETVIAPISSARTVTQLEDILPFAGLSLRGDELQRLREAAA